jgi:hypothetical protein
MFKTGTLKTDRRLLILRGGAEIARLMARMTLGTPNRVLLTKN